MLNHHFGLTLITIGLITAVVGLVVWFGGFGWFGNLPGDIKIEGENSRIYIPITSMILLSLLLTLVVNLVRKLFG